jgi:protein phosphatase
MPAISICPKPGCRAENTGRFCNRCGSDLTQINCPGCGKAYPEDLLAGPEPICEECGSGMARPLFLVTPPGRPAAEAGAILCEGRFRVEKALERDQYLIIDCKPNLKRLVTAGTEGSLASAYKKLAHLPGMPTILDVVADPAGGDYVLLGGLLSREGNLFPPLAERWNASSAQRRLGWLSAWTRLATALAAEGWSRTALELDNLRVSPDGNLSIRALLADEGPMAPAERLASLWLDLAGGAGDGVPHLARRLKAGEIGLVDAERELLALRAVPRVDVRYYGATNTGRKRENNEDSFLGWQASFKEMRPEGDSVGVRGLFAVCDGMGGHERGEVASRTCVQMLQTMVIPALMSEDPGNGDLAGQLRKIVREDVNSAILARNGGDVDGPFRRMGTTVVMIAVVDDRAVWVHVGDSRLYMVTRDRIEQLTEDHNVGTRDVKLGVATMLEAFRSPVGKHLTQALGPRSSEFVHPDTGDLDLHDGAVLLLCSDGLADMVPEGDMHKLVLANWDEPERLVAELIDTANEGGGLDNITALAVRVEPTSLVFPARVASAQPANA